MRQASYLMTYNNRLFDDLITKKCDKATTESTVALVFLFVVTAFFLYFGFTLMFLPIILLGLGLGVWGYYKIKKNLGDFKGGKFWTHLIKSKPDSIVWIKPIIERHTVVYVLTLYKLRKFQLLTNNQLKITITCASDQDTLIFLDGVARCLPDTHIGYSRDIADLYALNAKDFIHSVKAADLYIPASQLLKN